MARLALRHNPKRELWFAWWTLVVFYNLYSVVFFVVTTYPATAEPCLDTRQVVRWFDDRALGPARRASPRLRHRRMCAAMNSALIAYSIRRMSVSRAFAYSYLFIYSLSAVPGLLCMCVAMTVGTLRPDRDPE